MPKKRKKREPFTWTGDGLKLKGARRKSKLTDAANELSKEIRAIAEGARALLNSQLKPETIIWMLHRSSGVSMKLVWKVLEALESMDTTYLKEKKK